MQQVLRGAIGAVAVALTATLLLPAPAALASAAVKGTCSPTKVSFSASTTGANNTTQTYSNIPQATVTFTQGGPQGSCVLVQFVMVATAYKTAFYLRAMMDGVAGLPAETYFHNGDDTVLRTGVGMFIFDKVAPGSHTVQMQFHGSGGNPATLTSHNLIVNYAP